MLERAYDEIVKSIDMLNKPIEISSLKLACKALNKANFDAKYIEKTVINLFFEEFIKDYDEYEYEIVEESSEAIQQHSKIKVRIKNTTNNIDIDIGEVTFQFSNDSVQIIEFSNSIVSKIIFNRDSKKILKEILENTSLLLLANSFERFNKTFLTNNGGLKTQPSLLLEMSFFGTITETTQPHNLNQIIYAVVQSLQPPLKASWKNNQEFEYRKNIVDFLTDYILKPNINSQDIASLRTMAHKLEDAKSNTFRKISLAGIGISLPTFALAMGFTLSIVGGPMTTLLAIMFVAALSLSFFAVFAVYFLLDGKEDFPAQAVLFLADKMEEKLTSDNPSASLMNYGHLADPDLSPVQFRNSTIFYNSSELSKQPQEFEALCESKLKPVVNKICQNDQDREKVFNDIKQGLTAKFNQGFSIKSLESKIDECSLNKQTGLTELYKFCGLEISNDSSLKNVLFK